MLISHVVVGNVNNCGRSRAYYSRRRAHHSILQRHYLQEKENRRATDVSERF